jgi:hypothetical protein
VKVRLSFNDGTYYGHFGKIIGRNIKTSSSNSNNDRDQSIKFYAQFPNPRLRLIAGLKLKVSIYYRSP